jgi:transcriptional regulator with XRE-family HTH domain
MKRTPPLVPIRAVRQAYGLSARELADRILDEEGVRVAPDSLLNIELGHKTCSARLLQAWARALRLSPLDVHRPSLRDQDSENSEAGAA